MGFEVIDNQHKKLFKIINSVDEKETFIVIEELLEYSKNHFSLEEELFEKNNYEYSAEHLEQHKKLTQDILDLKAHFEGGSLDKLYFKKFLTDELEKHFLTHDRKFVEIFKLKRREK